jgi:hypothetical protein
MDYSFIKHTKVGKRFEERITVTRNRALGLPTQFCEDNNVKDYKFAVLFYDKEKNAIGIKFSNDENEEGKISITKNNQGYGAHILATSLFKANRINTKKYAGRYDYTKVPLRDVGFDEDGTLFVINLIEKEEVA